MIENKRITYLNDNGGVSVIVPSPKYNGTIEELAESLIGDRDYNVIDADQQPQSRNYRNAWKEDLTIDVEKAKECQRNLIVEKSHERVTPNEFGEKDFSQVKQELENIDFSLMTTIDEIYNAWPQSIDLRSGYREYK